MELGQTQPQKLEHETRGKELLKILYLVVSLTDVEAIDIFIKPFKFEDFKILQKGKTLNSRNSISKVSVINNQNSEYLSSLVVVHLKVFLFLKTGNLNSSTSLVLSKTNHGQLPK